MSKFKTQVTPFEVEIAAAEDYAAFLRRETLAAAGAADPLDVFIDTGAATPEIAAAFADWRTDFPTADATRKYIRRAFVADYRQCPDCYGQASARF